MPAGQDRRHEQNGDDQRVPVATGVGARGDDRPADEQEPGESDGSRRATAQARGALSGKVRSSGGGLRSLGGTTSGTRSGAALARGNCSGELRHRNAAELLTADCLSQRASAHLEDRHREQRDRPRFAIGDRVGGAEAGDG